MRLAVLGLVVLALSGCAGVLGAGLLLDAASTAVGTYQNYKARQEEAAKVEELRQLREEIRRLREQLARPNPPEIP